jgi:hypothetical protein
MPRYSKKQLLKEFCIRMDLTWTEKMSTVDLTNVVLQMKDKYVLANNESNMHNVWVFMEYYLFKEQNSTYMAQHVWVDRIRQLANTTDIFDI